MKSEPDFFLLIGNDAQSFSDFDEFSPHDSRPPSQRSKKTLRQVSSFLFISTPTSSGGLFVYIYYLYLVSCLSTDIFFSHQIDLVIIFTVSKNTEKSVIW